MQLPYAIVVIDVSCQWKEIPPRYRVFVNDELFAERTWRWTDAYLEEELQIEAEPGKYNLRWELVPPAQGTLEVKNIRIEHGSDHAYIKKNSQLRIQDESK